MNIKRKIKAAGKSITEVARLMPNPDGTTGIAQASLSAIISGNPTLNRLIDIANILGISVSELLSDDDEPNTIGLKCPHCGEPLKIEVK